MMDRLLDVISLTVFAFGALTFSTLALFYFVERRRGARRGDSVFAAFTLVCAIAFFTNLLLQTALSVPILAVRALAVALLPPLLLHVVSQTVRPWRWTLPVFYTAAIAAAIAHTLQENGVLASPWSDNLYRTPALALAAAAGLGLLFVIRSPRPSRPAALAHRRWTCIVLAILLACAAASLADAPAFIGQIPDYLLLAFFCMTLYYRERLVFFDVLMKRGLFLGVGLAVLIATWSVQARWAALLFWLAAPLVYWLVARAVDRLWLRRPYSFVEAERQFIHDVQTAGTDEELRTSAARTLTGIFQAPAQITWDGAATTEEDGLSALMDRSGACLGCIVLEPRPNGVPFLSDDRRLLQSLAATLAMVLENVRFRADRRRQEEREQQLRLLASRAELKALRAQINPHFLFNALSVIAGLMQDQPDLADETIERLAQVFRYTLRKSENEWAPLGEEMEFITAYLGIEQARFGHRLRVEFDIDPAVVRVPVPAMSIQPLIENAIKHGVSAREGPGTVAVRAAMKDGRLAVEVCDNGPGFPPGFSLAKAGESHGLHNVSERLRGYYGEAAALSWDSNGESTRVTLILPVENSVDAHTSCG